MKTYNRMTGKTLAGLALGAACLCSPCHATAPDPDPVLVSATDQGNSNFGLAKTFTLGAIAIGAILVLINSATTKGARKVIK